jgi:hypothetical protein
VNYACPDLCGGLAARLISTATIKRTQLNYAELFDNHAADRQ